MSDKPEMYLNLMESVIYEAARRGQGVIIGHGSQMLLHDFGCAMHVLVTAHEESRIHRLMHEMKLSREAAQKLIRQSDNQKKGFFRYAFHKDWDDPTLYDLYVNPDKIGSDKGGAAHHGNGPISRIRSPAACTPSMRWAACRKQSESRLRSWRWISGIPV